MEVIDNPWVFRGEPFLDCQDYAGFVYQIVDLETGRKYIGKKFFHTKRKPAKGKRRAIKESDWQRYYSSNEEIKSLAKKNPARFSRRILSLHRLVRDVNYMEVKLQYLLGVLEDPSYYNANISGKHHAYLVNGIYDRSVCDLNS